MFGFSLKNHYQHFFDILIQFSEILYESIYHYYVSYCINVYLYHDIRLFNGYDNN